MKGRPDTEASLPRRVVHNRTPRHQGVHPERLLYDISATFALDTVAYLERRVAAGHSERDAIRCLKRFLAREI